MLSFLRESVWRDARAMPKHLKEQYADPKARPIKLQGEEKTAAFVAALIKKVKDDKYDVLMVIHHQLPRRIEGELLEAVPLHYRAFRQFGYWMIEDSPIAKDKGNGDASGSAGLGTYRDK